MRISDGSSDVCSSDLGRNRSGGRRGIVTIAGTSGKSKPGAPVGDPVRRSTHRGRLMKALGLNWTIGSNFGWGTYGLELALPLFRRGTPTPVLLQEPARTEKRRVGEEWCMSCRKRWVQQ